MDVEPEEPDSIVAKSPMMVHSFSQLPSLIRADES
jgi:hypothetical protein